MPNVVSAIDGTSHEIQIPSNEPQQQFDSGHRKYHCITSFTTSLDNILVYMLWFFPKKYFDAEFSRKKYFCKEKIFSPIKTTLGIQ
jgi:hypothetical protein